ncbi:hypothetical protein [Xanthomonas sp. SHU 199]|uniref:Nmad2 family putative nucleotide modification protein n=1 Tax=Xanthomonas sp. SHU 199 TaxID=1591174 RepID=UPI0012FE9871|nr:hypothetical protein [Xanthomonas sp. SHU 199]
MDVYSYVVARDFGFAPNPFYQYCTLATCKPVIRRTAILGDLIIGTAPSPHRNQVVFCMEVTEALTFDEYWADPRFKVKRPNLNSSGKAAFGDNIYRSYAGGWLQADSHHTHADGSPSSENIDTDTSTNRVLISQNFSYWGRIKVELPIHLQGVIKSGPGHKRGAISLALRQELKEWFDKSEKGFIGIPREW